MTQVEEYQAKNQRLGYLIQLLTFFVTMNKAGTDLGSQLMQQRIADRIKKLADEELQEAVKLEVHGIDE